MSAINKIGEIKEEVLFYIMLWLHYSIVFLALKGIRINIYRLGKNPGLLLNAKTQNANSKSVPNVSWYDLLKKTRTKTNIEVVRITRDNVEIYLEHIFQVEKAAFEIKSYQCEKEDILNRFFEPTSLSPICFLYYKDSEPMAYTLGSNLEYYAPYDYGNEIAFHPGFLKFNSFYFETVAVHPDEHNSWLSARALVEILFEAKDKGFSHVLAHARMENKTHDLMKKVGFRQLYINSDFLDTCHEFAFVHLNLAELKN